MIDCTEIRPRGEPYVLVIADYYTTGPRISVHDTIVDLVAELRELLLEEDDEWLETPEIQQALEAADPTTGDGRSTVMAEADTTWTWHAYHPILGYAENLFAGGGR